MDERALFSMLAEAPDDLARRQVFMDALLEAGDPISEFLTLHRAHERAPLDTVKHQRMQDLLIMNWRRWLGPLAPILNRRGCAFVAGFLHHAEARMRKLPEGLLDAPQWGTVRSLDIIGEPRAIAAALESPWLRNLKHLHCASEVLARGAGRYAFSLETLSLSGAPVSDFAARSAWANVTRLSLRLENADALARIEVAPSSLRCEVAEFAEAVKLIARARTLERWGLVATTTYWQLTNEQHRVTCEAIPGEFGAIDLSPDDEVALRTLGDLELVVTSGDRRTTGPARKVRR